RRGRDRAAVPKVDCNEQVSLRAVPLEVARTAADAGNDIRRRRGINGDNLVLRELDVNVRGAVVDVALGHEVELEPAGAAVVCSGVPNLHRGDVEELVLGLRAAGGPLNGPGRGGAGVEEGRAVLGAACGKRGRVARAADRTHI